MNKWLAAFLLSVNGLAIICHGAAASAGMLRAVPFLQTEQIYSDNIRLSADDRQSAFVTSLNPGLSLFGQSARSMLNLNYRMQNLYNARGDGEVDVFNQLQGNGNLMLVPNRLLLNARGAVSQQNIGNQLLAHDNIAGVGARTNVTSFGASPIWQSRFGNYANSLVQVNFDKLSSGLGGQAANVFSDTLNVGQSVAVNSGPEFQRIGWGLFFTNNDHYRTADTDANVRFQNGSAIVSALLTRQFTVFAQGLFSDNRFQTITPVDNGFGYTVGAQWQPSAYYGIAAGYGNNRFVTLKLFPSQRFNWITTFRDNEIGLNPNQTWQTFLHYRTQRANWILRHDNDTTTTQAILLQLQTVTIDINPDPLIRQPVQFLVNIPTLTDEVIVRKLWNLSFSYLTGKSMFGVSAFNEDRRFQLTGNRDGVSGLNGLWNWQFAMRTNAFFSPGWQQIDRGGGGTDTRYDLAVGVNRLLTGRLVGRVELRHVDQSSELVTNNFQENRATASLFMSF